VTLAHLIYIPFLIALGVAVGWKLGSETIQSEWDRAKQRQLDKEEGRSS
jgi:hypothetical protein